MLVIIITTLGLILSFLLFKANRDWDNFWGEFGIFMTIVFGTVFIISMIALPMSRLFTKDLVRKYHSVAKTIETQRKGADAIERAALINKIMEINADLADAQYYAQSPWFNWFYDTSMGLMTLKPLQ